MAEPTGRPIPGVSTADDARFALDKARRYVFLRGGQWTASLHAYVDRWLPYLKPRDSESASGVVRQVEGNE